MSRPAAAAQTAVVPFALKDAPALIERLLPVQKLSAEAYKEQMAGQGKTLTGLGSYWKGRKPLILAKACVLGCLLPATEQAEARPRDLRDADGHGRSFLRSAREAHGPNRTRSSPNCPLLESRTTSRLLPQVRTTAVGAGGLV